MDKDVANLKKWLISVGLDVNDANDEIVKKLIPPQRRDMWRNIITHVRPEEEVDLIKKSLLLHKLQKLKKPLMARVESDEDLVNTLKYEELLTKFKKIEKEIIDIKIKNGAMETHLNEINETNDNLKKERDFINSKSYLAEQKTGYYNKFYNILRDLSGFCNYFASEANDDLTKSDYEDSLIKCFALVDKAKESGTLIESVNLGKDLCIEFYATIRDKSPAILLKTIEDNIQSHIDNSLQVIGPVKEAEIEGKKKDPEREKLFKEFLVKMMRKQLELDKILSTTITEKEQLAKKLVEASYSAQNDIINQFELRDLARTPDQLITLKINLEEAFKKVIKNSLNCAKIVGWPKKLNGDGGPMEKFNEFFKKINAISSNIERKKMGTSKILEELHFRRSDYGLNHINMLLEEMAANFSQKVTNIDEMNKLMISMKNIACTDVDNIQRPISELNIKPEAHKYRTLEEIADHIESNEVFAVLRKQFEQLDDIICAQNKFKELEGKETILRCELEAVLNKAKNSVAALGSSLKDCKITADAKLEKKSEK